MAVQTVEQVQRLAPYLEGLERRILNTAFGQFSGSRQTSPGLLDKPLNLPEYKVAGLDPLQQAAAQQAQQQFGMFQPYIQNAAQQQQMGVGALGQGLGMLDPSQGIQQFMDPYQDAVIDEINRQAAMGQNKLAGQAVQAGAFGGARQGIQAAEQEGRRLGEVGKFLSSGFQKAVESSQRAGQLLGGLGQAFGQGASQLADIGRLQSELGRADIGMLSQLGRVGQQQTQAELDAARQNQLQTTMDPFTRLELGSSLLKGTPSGSLSSIFKSTTEPSSNPFLQGVGAYTALQGATSA